MLGRKDCDQLELFMTGSLRQLVPDDHVLARVDRVLDLGWLRDEVADLYCADNGRPGIDPEVAVRLMLAGFLLGIVHDRRLMREAQVNLAIRWFTGYGLHEALPDHSSLTRIRQRWGAERFRRIFERTVQACMAAKIAKGEVVHVDASLIRADVSWESLAVRHVDAITEANGNDPSGSPPEPGEERKQRHSKKTGRFKKVCVTDPDASLATNGRNRRLEPSYKQHAVVDDLLGVVLDVEVTTGEVNEGQAIPDRLDAVAAVTGSPVGTVTADAGYAYAKVFAGLEARTIDAVIPTKAEPSPGKVIPTRRFKFDARANIARCPRGKTLRPRGRPHRGFQYFHARVRDCGRCPLRARCVSLSRHARVVVFNLDHPSLLRARRRQLRWGTEEDRLYRRHRWRSEGFHGEAKTWHGLARAVRRGLSNMRIQAFLTAAAINLKRLAAALLALLWLWRFKTTPGTGPPLRQRPDRAETAIPIHTRPAPRLRSAAPAKPQAGSFNSPKVHLGIDAETLEVRAIEVTGSRVGDGPMLPKLLEQIPAEKPIDTVTADGAYDTRTCHAAIAAREARAVIPTRCNGRPWRETTPGAHARNDILRANRRFGRAIWRNWSGYHRRSLIEAKMRCIKLLGEHLMARTPDRQTAEIQIRAALLNRFTALGTPETMRVA